MSSREPLVLVFDCGTQSTRAFLFNKKGDILAKVKLSVEPYFSTQAGYAEKNTDDYWASVCEVSKKLKEKSGDLWNDIIACSITTLRAVFVCLDKNNKPLRPSITWLDQRKATKFDKMPLINKFLFRLVGMHEAVKQQRKISTANWIKQFEPEIWAKTDKFVFESAYLNYKLCGEVCDSMASIIGRIPYDYKHFKWMTEKSLNYHIFGAEIDKMCPLKKPGELMGYITKEASLQTGIKEGLPIITTGSDKACETLGVGCLDRDVASLSFGTTATVQTTTDKYYEPQRFMPAYDAVVPDHYNPEVQIFRGYWMITWFKEQFAQKEVLQAEEMGVAPEALLDAQLKNIPVGSEGLILQPYWSPGLKIPEAKGAIIGFSDVHTRVHVYRAIIEGIGFALFEGLETLEKRTKTHINHIAISGGGSSSDAIAQITADMFGKKVYRVQTYETSGLGSAIMTFVGMKEFDSVQNALKDMVHRGDEFTPNEENHKLYLEIYNKVYKKVYKNVRHLYYNIKDIVKDKGKK